MRGLPYIVCVAPELEGAMTFIKTVHSGAAVALAHTTADCDTSLKAFNSGACYLTYLFNAMPRLGHRQPGPIAATDCPDVTVELIVDGVHAHPAAVREAFKLFDPERIVLISDSVCWCGCPTGITPRTSVLFECEQDISRWLTAH